MRSTREKGLVLVVTVYTALVIAGGMAAYGLLQYLWSPGETVLGLVLEHGWHVLALATMTYLALNMVIYRKVIRPIHELNLRLYGISKGDFGPVTVESRVKEVQEIAEVVTFLIAQIGRSLPGAGVMELSGCSDRVRSVARESDVLGEQRKDELMGIASDIDRATETLSMSSLRSARC